MSLKLLDSVLYRYNCQIPHCIWTNWNLTTGEWLHTLVWDCVRQKLQLIEFSELWNHWIGLCHLWCCLALIIMYCGSVMEWHPLKSLWVILPLSWWTAPGYLLSIPVTSSQVPLDMAFQISPILFSLLSILYNMARLRLCRSVCLTYIWF
jgi:hypothetical protein